MRAAEAAPAKLVHTPKSMILRYMYTSAMDAPKDHHGAAGARLEMRSRYKCSAPLRRSMSTASNSRTDVFERDIEGRCTLRWTREVGRRGRDYIRTHYRKKRRNEVAMTTYATDIPPISTLTPTSFP